MKTKKLEAKQYRFKVADITQVSPEFVQPWQTFELKKFKDDCETYASIGIDFRAEFRTIVTI